MHHLKKRLERWKDFEFNLSDDERNLLKLTEKNLVAIFSKEHENLVEFKKIKALFQSVDVHPFDSGNEPEYEKWNAAKQRMVGFLEGIVQEKKRNR